jgi:hypothetical protein
MGIDMNRLSLYVLLVCLLFSGQLFALRCGRSLVESGDYREDVYDKCGEPDTIQSHYEKRANLNHADNSIFNNSSRNRAPNSRFNYGQAYYQEVEVLVEEWRYDFGSSRLRKLLRFENGKLKEIIDLGRRR